MNPPYIGPLAKVIRLKLFLDIVPSSSEECDGCASVRYNSLFISLLLFTKVYKTTT